MNRLWWPLAAGVVMLLMASGCSRRHGSPDPVRFEPGDEVQFVPVNTGVFALTYDDGPNPPYTTDILDVLKEEGAKATFFLVGQNVERHPEVVRRIVAEGHNIGNHTFTHRQLQKLSREEVLREIDTTDQAIANATGERPTLFRASFGIIPPGIGAICKERGHLLVGWSMDGNDWNYTAARDIADLVASRLHPGAIVLLHDGRETKEGYDQRRCVEATRLILREAKARGYEAVSMRELIRHYHPGAEEIQFPDGLRFMGMRVTPTSVPAGLDFRSDYYWYFAADATRQPLAVAVHFTGAAGVAFQDDHDLNTHHIKAFEDKVIVPAGVKPGEYSVRIALCRQGKTPYKYRIPMQTELPVDHGMATTHTVLTVTKAEPAL